MERCELCLKKEASANTDGPRLRTVIRELFPFWHSDDITVVTCADCLRRIEDFHSFYKMVYANRLKLRSARASESLFGDDIKVEQIAVKVEWDDVVVKHDSTDDDSISETEIGEAPVEKTKKPKDNNTSAHPTELIRDGKFIVPKKILERMADDFFNLQCKECNRKFDKLDRMTLHYTSKHKSRPFVECCDQKFYRKGYMYQHMAKHIQPSAFECPVCKKDFGNTHVLKHHLGLHVSKEEIVSKRIHSCDKCNKSFGFKSLLARHMTTHVPDSERKSYTCEQCSKTFNRYNSYINHVRSLHSSPKFLCPECGKSFRQKYNLVVHLELHSGEKIQCQICAVMFKTNNALRRHMKVHSDVRFNCQQCEYSTHLNGLLKHHMLIKHSDEKPYSCDFCSKKFKLKKNLQTHIMAAHMGVRKYSCPYCPKEFAQSGNFFTHRKRMHDEEHKKALLAK